MPIDLQSFKVTHLGNTTVSVPQVEVECRVVDSQTQAERADYTGVAKKLVWPAVMSTLTVAERREVMEVIIQKVLELKLRALS